MEKTIHEGNAWSRGTLWSHRWLYFWVFGGRNPVKEEKEQREYELSQVQVVQGSGCPEADRLLLHRIDAVLLDHALEVADHLLRNALPHQ